MRLTELVEVEDGRRWRCGVCQWRCGLAPGETGRCMVRAAADAGIEVLNDGMISAATFGPVESHGLWHFFPDTQVLAIGGWGYAFPADHWTKLRSTNPLERVNREIGRRTDVVGIFPNDRSLIRLAASVVIEQNDEWLVGRRYLSAHSLEALLDQEKEDKDKEGRRELTAA